MANKLQVRVIRKFHDAKGILIGYTIQDSNGKQMDVYKDQLKQAVYNGQVECVNMTLTSDGRLIGRAAPEPKKRVKPVPENSGIKLLEVYTNGRNLIGGMISREEADLRTGTHPTEYNGLPPHIDFIPSTELAYALKKGFFTNVGIKDGKPDMQNVKRKSFSKVRDKMINILKANASMGVQLDLSVSKKEAGKYSIMLNNYDKFSDLLPMVNIIYCLICDACATEKIKLLHIIEDEVSVENPRIDDVRKVVKALKIK